MSEAVNRIHTLIRSQVRNRAFFENDSQAALMIEEQLRGCEVHPREVDNGGFSRKMNGSRGWTIGDVLALQAITGSTRIVEAMLRAARPEGEGLSSSVSALQSAVAIIKDVGSQPGLADLDPEVEEELLDIIQCANDALRSRRGRSAPVRLDEHKARA